MDDAQAGGCLWDWGGIPPLMCLHSQPQTEPRPVPRFQLPPCPQEPPGCDGPFLSEKLSPSSIWPFPPRLAPLPATGTPVVLLVASLSSGSPTGMETGRLPSSMVPFPPQCPHLPGGPGFLFPEHWLVFLLPASLLFSTCCLRALPEQP